MKQHLKTYAKQLQTIASIMAIILVAYFLTSSIATNREKLKAVDVAFNVYAVLGIGFFTGSVIATGHLWGRLLERLANKPVANHEAIRVQIASWLLKYIPGQVGSITGKLAWGMKTGFDKKTVSVSFIYENVLLVAASTIPTLPILISIFLDGSESSFALVLPFLVLIPLLLLVWRPVFYAVINKSLTIIGKKPLEKSFFLSDVELAKQFIKFLLPRALLATGFIFVAATVAEVTPSMYFGLGAAYVVAGVAGILVLFVPSGLGVREGVLTLLLAPYFSFEIAFIMALLARFYATIADGILALTYAVLSKSSKGSE